jgi:hypothetical protein
MGVADDVDETGQQSNRAGTIALAICGQKI